MNTQTINLDKLKGEQPGKPSRQNRGKLRISKTEILFQKLGIYVIALLLLVVGAFTSESFLTLDNMLSIIRSVAFLGIVVSGAAFVTYVGKYADMSIPAIIPLSGIVAVSLLPFGILPAVVGGILAGTMIGVMNGYVVGYLKANPILWTLAVMFFMEGLMRFAMSNSQIYPDVSEGTSGAAFVAIYQASLFGLPLSVYVMFALMAISAFVFKKTKFGQEAKLVGSAYSVAETTGINAKKTIFYAFVVTAFTSSIAGIIITSFNKTGVYSLGLGYDFMAVTATVLGGITLAGGRGSIIGALGGVLVMGLLSNLMTFMGVHPFQQKIVVGFIFIFVVGLNQYQLRKMGKDNV